MINAEKTIGDIVREMEENDRTGNTRISEHVTYHQRENFNRIDAYINSKHISSPTDSLGREKPFFNIVNAARNIWFRATDIDRKNIHISATKQEHYVLSFIANILLSQWMKTAKFGKWLNKWGRVKAGYGGAVSRFIEIDDELEVDVVPFNRIIFDPIDFDNNPKIIRVWLTPGQLRAKKEYNQKAVERLLTARTARMNSSGEKQDNMANYVGIYEVYGNFPLSYLTDKEEDNNIYVDQVHIMSYLVNKNDNSKYDDFVLYRGKLDNPLRLDNLMDEDGRAVGIGAVEALFEAQWMTNHSTKAIKDHLDITSKLITQTSDGSFVGQNVLNMIENGDILIHKPNQPLTRVDTRPDISALLAFANEWRSIANEQANISEAMKGETPKSGTAWRQTQAILMESHSLFEIMIENKRLALEEILREYIIPHLKKKMDTSKEISEILESHNVKKLDAMFVPIEAIRRTNEKIVKDILHKTPEDIRAGNLLDSEQQAMMIEQESNKIQNSLNMLGNQRFIKPSDIKDKTWKDLLKDFEWKVDIDVGGENKDKNAILTTLTTVLQTIAGNPAILNDERAKIVFNRILEETGALSAIEINSAEPAQALPAPAETPMKSLQVNQ